jgi:predicted ArsR family transcriptional regulator
VACAADRRAIELLLGEPVQQVATIVEGSPTCDYLVAKIGTTQIHQAGGEDAHTPPATVRS